MTLTPRWVSLAPRRDARGLLLPVELERDLPFRTRRTYFIVGTPAGIRRGAHAHVTLTQVACCLQGSCTMAFDDGRSTVEVRLDDPSRALVIPPMTWHEMYDFSAHSVLAVFADAPYDEADYIRDHEAFLAEARAAR